MDETVARGAPIGKRGNRGSFGFSVRCSDEFDANGKPVFYSPPSPPAPPVPAAPVAPPSPAPPAPSAAPLAPLAPVAPLPVAPSSVASLVAPKPAPKPAPMAAPVPPAPLNPPSDRDQTPPAPLAVPPTPAAPNTPAPPKTPASEPQPQKTRILAPFGARVLAVEPGVAGASIVKLQEHSDKPIKPGDRVCLATYETVTSPNVVAGQEVAKGAYVGLAPVAVVSHGVTCGKAQALGAPLKVRQGQTLGKADFRLSGETSAVLAQPAEISSPFGVITDPFTGQQAFHVGVDVKGPEGLAVRAPAAGTVTFAGEKGTNGKVVELDLGGGVTMKFGHLNDISVALGDAVKAGGTLGTMGMTGRTTGSHVHIEVYRNGKAYDPASVENLTLSTR
jgi:murein DD-endopeptidase MepM/ murein hydrolase activator NlpD